MCSHWTKCPGSDAQDGVGGLWLLEVQDCPLFPVTIVDLLTTCWLVCNGNDSGDDDDTHNDGVDEPMGPFPCCRL